MNAVPTTGPWFATRREMSLWEVSVSPNPFSQAVAFVCETKHIEGEAEANAQLLASAPDLLAERDKLKAMNAELMEALDSAIWLIGLLDGQDNSCEPVSDISDLRAVLAKNKGATE